MDLFLKDKVVIVLGGSSGIGRKVCHTYAEEGACPVIFVRNKDRGLKTLKECKDIGVEALLFIGDCSIEQDCRNAAAAAVEKFGRVDILVHSAAPYTDGSAISPLLSGKQGVWEDFVNVIMWGAIYSTLSVLPVMFKNRYGRLLYVSSDAGREGDSYQPVYSACKASLVGFMKSMAHYGGSRNVLANVVSPALTITGTERNKKMIYETYHAKTEDGMRKLTKSYATGRLATAQDLANMIVFLTSDRASDVTGQVMGVNGGHFMPSI
jgi:NAD(P)-dependent dehydrogenase (short-subunit alcohol dehydrogenase family)